MGSVANEGGGQTSRGERPRTARRPPPKVKSNLVDDEKVPSALAVVQRVASPNAPSHGARPGSTKAGAGLDDGIVASGVILDSEQAPEEEEGDSDVDPEDRDRVPDGEEGGKVMRDIMKAMADVKKGKKKEEKPSAVVDAQGGITFTNKLGAAKGRGAATTTAVNATEQKKQNEQLRDWVQRLCQSVNPLGKCVDFVAEDLDTMGRELQHWEREATAQAQRLQAEQRKTTEVLAPVRQQLADAERECADLQRQIYAATAAVLRNEAAIAQLLNQHAAAGK